MKKVTAFIALVCIALGLAACGGGDSAGGTQVDSATTLSVIQTGSASYSVQGANLDGITGIDLTLNYDTASLSSPSISQGSLVTGAMMVPNTNIPGTIRIAIISTKAVSGSGQIASISFGSQTGSSGIVAGTALLIDSSGKSVNAVMKIQASSSGTPVAPVAPFTPVPAEPAPPVPPSASTP